MNKFLGLLGILSISTFGFSQEQKLTGVAAIVGDEIVTYSEINDAIAYMGQQGNTNECEAVNTLLKQKFILNQAKKDTLMKVDPKVIDENVSARLEAARAELGSDANIAKTFRLKGISDVREAMKAAMISQAYVQQQTSKVTIDANVSPQEVKKFYEENQYALPSYIPETVEYSQLLIYPKLSTANKKEYIDKLNSIKAGINNENDFSRLAKEYSDDPGSKNSGGLYTAVTKGKMVKEFEDVAFSLGEGKISEPFETDFGYHIIYLIKNHGTSVDVRHILLQTKPTDAEIQQAVKDANPIYQEIKDEKITYAKALDKYGEEKNSNLKGMVKDPNTGNTLLEKTSLPSSISNAILGLGVGNVSEPILDTDYSGKPVVKIIYLSKDVEGHTPSVDTDYDYLKKFAINQKKSEMIDRWIKAELPYTRIKIYHEAIKGCTSSSINWMKN